MKKLLIAGGAVLAVLAAALGTLRLVGLDPH